MSGKRIKRRMNRETRGRTDIAIALRREAFRREGGKWTRSPKDIAMSYQNVYSSTKPEFEVERVDGERINARGVNEFLVKWYGYVDKERTWEPITNTTHADSMIADRHARNENLRSCPHRRPSVDDSSPAPAENSLPETPTTRRMTRSQARREI
jgi:hypothetical protein